MSHDVVSLRRFIPYRKIDLIDMCLFDKTFSDEDEEKFEHFAHLIESVLHYENQAEVERIKNTYALMNPDTDIIVPKNLPAREIDTDLSSQLIAMLERANYDRIDNAQIEDALESESLFNIRLHLNLDDFDKVVIYARGEIMREEELTSLWGLFKKKIKFVNYERVVVYLRFKECESIERRKMPLCKPGTTLLKLFRDVPANDLEMLFPNTEVGMRLKDKVLIGLPAAISGIIVLTTKLGTTLILIGSLLAFYFGMSDEPVEFDKPALLGLAAGVGALVGYLWKQFTNFKNRKIQFMKTLAENLYFKNLDNNAGVFYRLANDAEEEEFKEIVLGYYFLLSAGQAMTAHALDQKVQNWFKDKWDYSLDFDVTDALAKLLKLELIQQTSADMYEAKPLADACQILDNIWDSYFDGDRKTSRKKLYQPETA